jgi:hypothetical protein
MFIHSRPTQPLISSRMMFQDSLPALLSATISRPYPQREDHMLNSPSFIRSLINDDDSMTGGSVHPSRLLDMAHAHRVVAYVSAVITLAR